jgi:hypothetical protein
MENEQLNEEQLYFKNKYLKYKLKYLTLKQQQEGGLSLTMPKFITKIARNYTQNNKFEIQKIKDYLDTYGKTEDKTKKDNTYKYKILETINNKLSASRKIDATIDKVINDGINDKTDKDKVTDPDKNKKLEELRPYLKQLIIDYNEYKAKLDNFNPKTTIQGIERECTCHTIIKKDILTKIQKEFKNNIIIDKAIDAVLKNNKDLENDKENLRSYLTKLLNNYVTNQAVTNNV